MSPALHNTLVDYADLQFRAAEFDTVSLPLIRRMMDIELIHTTPFMVVKDGLVVESGKRWNNPDAKALYDQYENSIRVLHDSIFSAGIAALEDKK